MGLEGLEFDRPGRLLHASDRELLRSGDAVRDAELGVPLTDQELPVRVAAEMAETASTAATNDGRGTVRSYAAQMQPDVYRAVRQTRPHR